MGGVDDTARREYQIPDPMVDARELRKLDELTKRYEELPLRACFRRQKMLWSISTRNLLRRV